MEHNNNKKSSWVKFVQRFTGSSAAHLPELIIIIIILSPNQPAWQTYGYPKLLFYPPEKIKLSWAPKCIHLKWLVRFRIWLYNCGRMFPNNMAPHWTPTQQTINLCCFIFWCPFSLRLLHLNSVDFQPTSLANTVQFEFCSFSSLSLSCVFATQIKAPKPTWRHSNWIEREILVSGLTLPSFWWQPT